MPKQLVFRQAPERLSIVEYDLTAGEDIFLTYTWERAIGPPIIRHGKGSPRMRLIGRKPNESTTDPLGFALCTWLILEETRRRQQTETQEMIRKLADQDPSNPMLDILQRTSVELKRIDSHDKVFRKLYPGYEIIGQQGCSDLTMNLWNVCVCK